MSLVYILVPHASSPISSSWDRLADPSTSRSTVHPVTLLSSLLDSQEEMSALNSRLKMSGYERDLGHFVIGNREPGEREERERER